MAASKLPNPSLTVNSGLVTAVRLTPKGYPPTIFHKKLDDKFLCVLCTFVLRDPQQSYCGHRVCKGCLDNFIVTALWVKCPKCDEEGIRNGYSDFKSVFADRAFQRELLKNVVTCELAPKCGWSGVLKTYDKHLKSCQFRLVQCSFGCSEPMEMSSVEKHNAEHLHQHLEALWATCKTIENEVCQNSDGPIAESTKALHLKITNLSDLLLALKENMNEMEKKIAHNNETMSSITKSQIDQLYLDVNTLDTFMNDLFGLIEERYEHLSRIKTGAEDDQSTLDDLRRTITQLERSIQMKDTSLNEVDLRIQAMEYTSHDGILIYRIDQWQRKFQDATNGSSPSIYTPPFYTGRAGYKMCLRLYPNGDGIGQGSYLSVFFVVMRGPHDAILSWPFKQKVTLALLDQTGNDHILEAFRPDPSSSSFRKPISDMNIASGCPTFAAHSKLQNGSKYVVDDVMFIKATVDVSNI